MSGTNLWMRRIILSVIVLFSTGFFCLQALPANAQLTQATNQTSVTANAAGIGAQSDLITIIGRIINIALGFVGVIFLVILIYAGYTYMTAGGDPKKVETAQAWIRNAVIGMIIVAFSFAIVNFILNWLTSGGPGLGGTTGTQWPGGSPFGNWNNSGSLGTVIEYHFPERDQKDVARNTAIAITFKQAIDPASFINGWTPQTSSTSIALNDALIKIHPQKSVNQNLTPNQARVHVSEDKRTIVIKPVDPLGNSKDPVWYEVALTGGKDGIKNASGTALFAGSFEGGYSWVFQVSTNIDNTPPYVVARIPFYNKKEPRNVIVQLEFSEPMMPIAVSGMYKNKGFTNLTTSKVDQKVETILNGEYRISNGYKTINFIPDDPCGTNSCMMTVYCLPASSTIRGLVKAAELGDTPPQAKEGGPYGYNGAVDMAGNSLDGNHDGTATGPGQGGDDYAPDFTFFTSEEIRLSAPFINKIEPTVLQGEVAIDKTADAYWDSILLAYTINTDSAYMKRKGQAEDKLGENMWYSYPKSVMLNAKDTEVQYGEEPIRTRLSIYHRPFLPSDQPKSGQDSWEPLNLYSPYITHQVMDIYQNCFKPATSKLGTDLKEGHNNLCNEMEANGIDCNKTDSSIWKGKAE